MTTILILAGKRDRDSRVIPLTEAAGVSHKCVVPVAGRPMIEWVIAAAAETQLPILISLDEPDLLSGIAVARDLERAGRLRYVPPHSNIVESVLAAAAMAEMPLMITTADNVLVTGEALLEADRAAERRHADCLVALARKEDILAAHPEAQHRFYPFRDGEFSNCNLFWLRDHNALRIAETFREGGRFLRNPGRIVRAFGLMNLIRFRYGLATLDGWFAGLSRRFRLNAVPYIFADGRLAIDVDNERTHRVAEELLGQGPEAAASAA
jgi:molybdopterin-guanine dinucleotide biosynthesis protein A